MGSRNKTCKEAGNGILKIFIFLSPKKFNGAGKSFHHGSGFRKKVIVFNDITLVKIMILSMQDDTILKMVLFKIRSWRLWR